ncbi:MAG: type II secretion system F family protein [Chloroflexi bacterium]|nr:type II secretion system F family protein [Chloroflexota bacterium]
MNYYRYVALDANNNLVKGTIEAQTQGLAADRLASASLRVLSLRGSASLGWRQGAGAQAHRLSRRDLVLLAQQLATLLEAGISLLAAMQLLRDQAETAAMRAILERVIAELKEGRSLHQALGTMPRSFPPVFVRTVAVGEGSGALEGVLRQFVQHMEREIAVVQQLRKAMTYPAVVVLVGLVVVGVLVTVVLPTFAELLSTFNARLPLITRLMVSFSTFVQAWKLPVLMALVATGALGWWTLGRPAARRWVDSFLFRAPLVSPLMVQQSLARFSRTMAMLMRAGLPLPECLSLARDSAGNGAFRGAITQVGAQVVEGRSLAQALGAFPFVPRMYAQVLRVGEETGTLEHSLQTMAEFYERKVEERLTTMTGLLEPAVTVFMGLLVGLVALSVMLPLLSVMKSFQSP